jgi:hypothetical protein
MDCLRGQAERGPAQGDQGTGQRGLIGPQTFGCLCCRRGLCQPCRSISWLGAACTGGLWPQPGGGCCCPQPWSERVRMPDGGGPGPGVVPQRNRWRDRESGSQGRLYLLSLATHLLEWGQEIRTIQGLLSHKEVSTTMTYTPVLNCGPPGVRSPADILVPGEQLVLGPVNWRYLGWAFGKTRGGAGSCRGWPSGCLSGSRKGTAGRLWFSESSNKELGGKML